MLTLRRVHSLRATRPDLLPDRQIASRDACENGPVGARLPIGGPGDLAIWRQEAGRVGRAEVVSK